jgi:hypothetical protein
MSEPEGPVKYVDVDVQAWVNSARSDPVLFQERQITEIVLTAIGLSPALRDTLVLKGGTLMALAFTSARVTNDVDFTALVEPLGFVEVLRDELDSQLSKAAAKLGYVDLLCRVQRVEKKPRPQNFENLDFPALLIRVGYAERGSAQETALTRRNAARVVEIEVSFRDQVYHFQDLCLTDAAVAIRGFSLTEVIAEKTRALLQQPVRDRFRRQDVFDIAYLCDHCDITQELKAEILDTLLQKCESRGIHPTRDSIDDREVYERAKEDWDTIELEVVDLPDFDERFAVVKSLYHSLPWAK